ncbi:15181_t:CDS:1, partial [Racocetra persica]
MIAGFNFKDGLSLSFDDPSALIFLESNFRLSLLFVAEEGLKINTLYDTSET